MAGGRWPRRHRGRFGCLVAAVVVFVVGMATVATWILAGLLGLTGIHAGSSAVPGQVVLAVAVGAILLVALGRSARRVSAPVTDLLAAADRLAIGDYEVRVPDATNYWMEMVSAGRVSFERRPIRSTPSRSASQRRTSAAGHFSPTSATSCEPR